MTKKFNPNAPHYKWFKEEQGRFLKEARNKNAISLDEVSKHLGFDVHEVESGKSSLPMSDLVRLMKLYHVPDEAFMLWQLNVGQELRQMIARL